MGNAVGGRHVLSVSVDPPPVAAFTNGHYLAGSRLSGVVYAETSANLSPQTQLLLTLVGEERTCVEYQESETYRDGEGRTHTRYHTRHRYATRQLVYIPVPLLTGGSSLQPGRYVCPFEVDLPSDLPSSMSYRANGGYCEIRYQLTAELTKTGFFSNVHQPYSIYILATPLPPQPMPYMVEPFTEVVNMCCCGNMGVMTLGAQIENTRVGHGQAIHMDFACQNDSKATITCVQAKLEQFVSWQAGGRSEDSSCILTTTNFQQTDRMVAKDQQQVQEKTKTNRYTRDGNAITASAKNEQQALYQALYRDITDGKNRAVLQVNTNSGMELLPTYRGACIRVQHILTIKAMTEQSSVNNPKLKVDICIGTPAALVGLINTAGGPPMMIENNHNNGYDRPPAYAPGNNPNSYQNNTNPPAYAPSAPPGDTAYPVAMLPPSAPPTEWDSTNVTTAKPVVVTSDNVWVAGGTVVDTHDNHQHTTTATTTNNNSITTNTNLPSLPALVQEMTTSVSPLSTVKRKLRVPQWQAFLRVLTPSEFATIVQCVAIDFEQPEVAAAMAEGHASFLVAHIVAVLGGNNKNASWIRTSMVQRLVPHCRDLAKNQPALMHCLSEWEVVCTQDDIDRALQAATK